MTPQVELKKPGRPKSEDGPKRPRRKENLTPEELVVHNRQVIERRIVFKVITDLVEEGFVLRVHDGEDWATEKSTDVKYLKAAMFATDEEDLYVYLPDGTYRGVVNFVYGNDGHDVIADNSTSLEADLAAVTAMADRIAEGKE
jgi:hypothetical protein